MKHVLLKKGDIAVIATVLALCAAMLIPRFIHSGVTAVIYVGGEEYRRINLSESAELTLEPDTDPAVVIKVSGGAIYFESADCPDKLCVKTGKLSSAGDTAACLPAGVVITLEGSDDNLPDAITG